MQISPFAFAATSRPLNGPEHVVYNFLATLYLTRNYAIKGTKEMLMDAMQDYGYRHGCGGLYLDREAIGLAIDNLINEDPPLLKIIEDKMIIPTERFGIQKT